LESTLFPVSDDDGEMVFVKEEIDSLVSNVKTVAFGMGIGVSEETGKILEYLIENYSGTMIVDADGLTCLSKLDREKIRSKKCKLVLTPHIKEFERLSGHEKNEILEHSIDLACEYALDIGAVVLLKGPSTIVTDGTEVYIVDAGCSGMATAGSGDVLSGILSATCAYIPDTLTAVAAGAYINGKAGEAAQDRYGSVSMVASDTVTEIAGAIAGLSKQV
ncbi:MAG: NAD(P)H-hydrate dehydratase, partial [Lachnospiraceae bacterium]|nr:NAD(P)H-hydrate dehydratase [Lachnospiraceae bacterium]